MNRWKATFMGLGMAMALTAPAMAFEAFKGPLGVLQVNEGVSDGYVLFTTLPGTKTYLIDNQGKIINEWTSQYKGFSAEMLPNGNMVRHSRYDDVQLSQFGGTCGVLEEFDWEGNKVWEYVMNIPGKEVSHHTFEVMPNGNYMILGWEYKSYDEAVAAGLDPNVPGRNIFKEGFRSGKDTIMGIWPDFIREVDRKTNETVWEWHVWDHLGTGPNQIDINKFDPPQHSRLYAGPDWTHFNGVAYNPRTDQVCVTSRNLAEAYVIDKKTGDIVYRWGNPANYGQGRAPAGYSDDGDQKLWGPHAPDWTPQDTITILDNGNNRPSGNYTRAVEVDPKTDKMIWEWKPRDVFAQGGNFYSAYQCGAQKIANGNWLITSTNDGHVIEVTPDKSIVWEFVSPVGPDGQIYKVSNQHGTSGGMIHKAMRYLPDYPGFQGKNMKGKGKMPNWVKALNEDAPALKTSAW